jgi:hypothetical protein
MNLTSDQVRAVRDGDAVPIVSPEIGEDCVLIRRDVYERLREVVEDDLPTSRAIAGLVRATLEDDPFDDYQEYRR